MLIFGNFLYFTTSPMDYFHIQDFAYECEPLRVYTLTSTRLIVLGWKVHFFAKELWFLETCCIVLILQWIAYVCEHLYVYAIDINEPHLLLGENCTFFTKKYWILETSYTSLFVQWITSIFKLLLTYVNPFVYVVHTQKNRP